MKNIKDLSNKKIYISPSILAADFANLGKEVLETQKAGVEIIHIDVMDGHFVPNISIGVPVIKSLRNISNQIFDTHLMISEPLKYIEAFSKSGSNHITFHIESQDNTDKVIHEIRRLNMSVGISIKPRTEIESIIPYLDKVDLVLIMTVEPGFGGQSFMKNMMSKVSDLKEIISKNSSSVHIEVDGGIDAENASYIVNNGANILVAGTSVFRYHNGISAGIDNIRKSYSLQ